MDKNDKLSKIGELLDTFSQVRKNCPWDQKQTMETLKTLTVEECYELIDAVNNGDYNGIKEELGDLLMHILFYAEIAEEEKRFGIGDVAESINTKLIRRHPHIFGNFVAENADDVAKNWEQIKIEEKKNNGKEKQGVLSGVPSSLPPMVKAFRIQSKAAGAGFDWKRKEDIWEKLYEEITEAIMASDKNDYGNMEEEIGDILFSIVNISRAYGIDPDNALEKSNRKFIGRFGYVEKSLKERGINFKDSTLEEMDGFWNEAKKRGL